MAYMPTIRTITVDMSKLSGSTTARWYDPSAGTYSAISGSPFVNTGTQQFTPSGKNNDGDGDWVLVLEATPNNSTPASPAGGGGGVLLLTELEFSSLCDNYIEGGERHVQKAEKALHPRRESRYSEKAPC
jgi:hypothetical protein